jgi:MoxR-like ATPase
MVDAVNAAIHLRRPLLLTGPAGSGKSTVIEQIAHEAGLGEVLRWHITSHSTLIEALYRYDALGRIHAQTLRATVKHSPAPRPRAHDDDNEDDIAPFLQLGPLGTALLPGKRPRALLIDEIDKSDLDLPSDLLEVLERGEFEIPELARYHREHVAVRMWKSQATHTIKNGFVRCSQFPIIVMTSNGERDFPPAFLRRCIRYTMPPLNEDTLSNIVHAHLGSVDDPETQALIGAFARRLQAGDHLAVDQLLNAVSLLSGNAPLEGEQRKGIETLLLQELGRD